MIDEIIHLRALATMLNAAREADDAWDRDPRSDVLSEKRHEAWTRVWDLLDLWNARPCGDLSPSHLEE